MTQKMEKSMKRIAKFHKVSFEQFKEGWMGGSSDYRSKTAENLRRYQTAKTCNRRICRLRFLYTGTFSLKSGETIKIPTGIRVEMEEGWVLKLYPRSGLGIQIPPAAGQ